MNVSNYNRREKDSSHIKPDECVKLSEILEINLDDIYEYDAKYHIDCKDQSIAINQVTQKVYTIPKTLIDSQQKYVKILETKINKLKNELDKYK